MSDPKVSRSTDVRYPLAMRMEFYARIAASKISPAARNVAFCLLYWHMNGTTGRCDPEQSTIATRMNMSERSVERGVHELVKAGWFTVIQGGGHYTESGPTNAYLPNLSRIGGPTILTALDGRKTKPRADSSVGPWADNSDDPSGSRADNPDGHNLESSNLESKPGMPTVAQATVGILEDWDSRQEENVFEDTDPATGKRQWLTFDELVERYGFSRARELVRSTKALPPIPF